MNVKKEAPKPSPEPVLLRASDVAKLLAISPNQVYVLINRGELPGVIRLGRSVRVHAPTLLAWLTAQAEIEHLNSLVAAVAGTPGLS